MRSISVDVTLLYDAQYFKDYQKCKTAPQLRHDREQHRWTGTLLRASYGTTLADGVLASVRCPLMVIELVHSCWLVPS